MDGYVVDSLKSIRNLVNLYLLTLGYFFLHSAASWFSTGALPDDVEVFKVLLGKGSFSLAYGVLFTTLVFLLYSRLRLLAATLEHRLAQGDDQRATVELVQFFPWAVSPFRRSSKVAHVLFLGIVSLGLVFLVLLARGHIFTEAPPGMTAYCRWHLAGCVDLVLLAPAGLLGILVARQIRHIRDRLCSHGEAASQDSSPP